MRIKIFYLFAFCLVIIISGCSNIKELNIENSQDKESLLELTSSSKDIEISSNMEFLKGSEEVVDSLNKFSQVKAFIPNENYLQHERVKEDYFQFISLPENHSLISGKLIFENNTEENMKVQSLFLQGNKKAMIKTTSSQEWSSSILYDVPPKSSVKINIDIKWDEKGMPELTFFPLDHTSAIDRYNGANLSTFRYFVLDKVFSIDRKVLEEHSFELENLEDIENASFYPIPTWIGIDNEEIEYIVKNETLFTKEKVSGLKLDAVPYDTEVDLLLIDEFGNTTVLFQNVKIHKYKSTIVDLSTETLEKMSRDHNKNYIMIINNRGVEMLVDLKSLDRDLKPFSTSYQSIIQFYKNQN